MAQDLSTSITRRSLVAGLALSATPAHKDEVTAGYVAATKRG